MALALMAKAFTLNDTTPINNNQKSSSNPSNILDRMQCSMSGIRLFRMRFRIMAEANANGINGKHIRCYNNQGVDHYASNCIVKPRKQDAASLQKQMQIAQKEEEGNQLTYEEFDFMADADACEETKRANEISTLENNLQQASTSGTQSDKALVYDSTGLAEKMDLDCQNPFYLKQAQQKQQSLYNGKVILEKHDPPTVYDLEETLELAQEKAAKFVRDFQSLSKEADESLAKHKAMELEIERLLRAVVSERKDTTKGISVNTQFCKQSILGKPPSSFRSKLYFVTPFPKSKGFPKIGESHALSKPVTSNSVPNLTESKGVKNDNVIFPGIFRMNPFKDFWVDNFVPNKHVKASVRTKPITVSQPYAITNVEITQMMIWWPQELKHGDSHFSERK
nr:hypothetical protein [Tanacetum cinerariifolium]